MVFFCFHILILKHVKPRLLPIYIRMFEPQTMCEKLITYGEEKKKKKQDYEFVYIYIFIRV